MSNLFITLCEEHRWVEVEQTGTNQEPVNWVQCGNCGILKEKEMSTGINIEVKKIETVKDLLKACNGNYELFGETIKNYLICKGGKLMTWEDWYKKPHPMISETEDAIFEIVETKQLPTPNQLL